MSELWSNSLQIDNTQAGYKLAIKLSRMGAMSTQPSDEIRNKLQSIYGENTDSLRPISIFRLWPPPINTGNGSNNSYFYLVTREVPARHRAIVNEKDAILI